MRKGLFHTIIHRFWFDEKIPYHGLVRQEPADNPKHIEGASVELAVMLNDGNETVCDDRNIYLYSDSILGCSPKGSYSEMLLYPSEEEFNLPSLLVQHCDILCPDTEVVSQVGERSFQIRSIVNYSPQHGWILFLGLITRKLYRLVKKYVVLAVKKLLSIYDFVFEVSLLPNDKVRFNDVYRIQPLKVIISLVKDVERIRLITNLIHRPHIMNFSFSDMNVGRNLSHNIEHRMEFDAGLLFPEVRPLEQAQAQVNRRGVKRIELARKFKRSVDSLLLSDCYHSVGKLFKHLVVSVRIGIRQTAEFYRLRTESETVALSFYGTDQVNNLAETVTCSKLTEDHHEHLVPTTEAFQPLVTIMSLYYSIKNSFGQKVRYLTENIFAFVHCASESNPRTNIQNDFKSTRGYFVYNLQYINNL